MKLKTATRRTNQELDVILGKMNDQNNEVKNRAEKIIDQMLEHNDKLDPGTLARAALFVSKKQTSHISREDLEQIKGNGKLKKDSWIDLVPVVEKMT